MDTWIQKRPMAKERPLKGSTALPNRCRVTFLPSAAFPGVLMLFRRCIVCCSLTVTVACAPLAYTSAVPATPVSAAQTADEARALVGGAPTSTASAEGLALQTGHTLPVRAGHCYDLGIVADAAVSISVMVHPGEALRFPAELGNTNQGRSVQHVTCADADGSVMLELTAAQMFRPGSNPSVDRASFAIAVRERVEDDAAHVVRHALERDTYRMQQKARCDKKGSTSAVYDCMQALDADIEARAR